MNCWFSLAKQAVSTRFIIDIRAKLALLLNRSTRPEKQEQQSDFAVLQNTPEASLGKNECARI